MTRAIKGPKQRAEAWARTNAWRVSGGYRGIYETLAAAWLAGYHRAARDRRKREDERRDF